MNVRCLGGCGRLVPTNARKGRCVDCRRTVDQHYTGDWPLIRLAILERDHWTCSVCGEYADQVDHIVPVSKGGTHEAYNLQAMCKSHNSGKRDR